jgi:hypothetical protein
VLAALDPQRRSEAELHSATNLLLGMLNGIARRPFLRSPEDTRALAAEVGALFQYGFLGRPETAHPAQTTDIVDQTIRRAEAPASASGRVA